MVQIAFLSGFDDFTYAQQAIQYNIVSYMLKPISAKEIEAELIKIKKAMDQRVEEFTKERKEKLDIRKTQFLIPLLLDSFQNERVSEEALLERAEECELIRNPKPDNMQYVVLVTGIRDANGKDQQTQHTNSGGSGCGCAAITLAAYIMPQLISGEWKRILFVPTGALMSTVSFNEGESVPGIAHGIVLEHC